MIAPLAAGQYHPANCTTEIGGVGTFSTARRQGLAAEVTAALVAHARGHGVHTIFLAYAKGRVARLSVSSRTLLSDLGRFRGGWSVEG